MRSCWNFTNDALMLSPRIEGSFFNGFEYDIQLGMKDFTDVGNNGIRVDWFAGISGNITKFQFEC